MNTTVLKLSESDAFLKNVSIRTIKDVRALDVDLLLILVNGDRIVISNGAMQALNAPDMALQFSDGQLPLARVFQQIDHIDVSPEANLTVSSKEITRYNQNNARVNKSKKDDDEGSRPIVQDAGEKDPAAATTSQGTGGNAYQSSSAPVRAADHKEQLADTEVNSDKEKDKSWGVQWPIATGALALLAAAGGGGGGGGSGGGNNGNGGSAANAGSSGAGSAGANGSGAGAGTGSGKTEPPRADITGAAALGPIKNANITAYDQFGNAISATTEVVDGKYTLVLNKPFYKGPMLLVIRDNTPGVADNYIDEASLRTFDLGHTPLRAVVMANGVNQKVNVTAFTELAAIKAGLAPGVTSLADAPQVTAARINSANDAVSAFFKIDAIGGDVVPTVLANARDQGVFNPAYNAGLSTAAQNYGAALKAVSNLVQIDPATYPSQAVALQKMADVLQFADAGNSALKWAPNARGESLQAALFGESLQGIIDNPGSTPEAIAAARTKLDALQNLPNGSSVAEYLVKNHVAIANPTISIKQAQVANPREWQNPPALNTLKLDQGDFLEGSLRVEAPPNAKVSITVVGQDQLGRDVLVKLPDSQADANGHAILRADDASVAELLRFDPNRSVTAQVSVSDGFNSRTNFALWKIDADVRVDLNTPASMTRFAAHNALVLAEDTYYTGANGDTNKFPQAARGSTDGITGKGDVRVTLNQELRGDERLQFSVATALDRDGSPLYGVWKEAARRSAAISIADSSNKAYIAEGVTEVNGENWIRARVVQVGNEFTGGVGNANTSDSPLNFTLDTIKPAPLRLGLASGLDDGISTTDGITSKKNTALILTASREPGTELHIRLDTGATSNTLSLTKGNGTPIPVIPGTWHVLGQADTLTLTGDTPGGNGRARLLIRQIDNAGNFTDTTQTFVVDSTGVIQQTVMLATRHKALKDAQAKVDAANTEFSNAGATTKSIKQQELNQALAVRDAERAADEKAMADARQALRNADGTSRLDEALGKTLDVAYLPAIVNRISATADVDQVNDAVSLNVVVDTAIAAANAAVAKVSVYGDNDTNPAPSMTDYTDMGILGLSRDKATAEAQLAAINDALRMLPLEKSNHISKIQATTNAYLKLLALANGREDTEQAKLPSPDDYAALGVSPPLSQVGATIVGAVIDGANADKINTVAKLSEIADAAQRIATRAAASVSDNTSARPTPAHFKSLGIDGVNDGNIDQILSALNDGSASQLTRGKVVGAVDTLDEVKALVAAVIGPLTVLINYAKGVTLIDPDNPSQRVPTVENFRQINANGIVNNDNLAAINSAIKAAGPSGADRVDSWAKVTALVSAYNRVLALADGIAGNTALVLPTLADYSTIGVKALDISPRLVAAQQAHAVTLLNSVLDSEGNTRAQASTVEALGNLANIVARVITLSADRTAPFTAAELAQLHPSLGTAASALDELKMNIVRSGIAGGNDDGSDINNVSKLSNVIRAAFLASDKIRAYAEDDSRPQPTQQDYHDLGITGLDKPLYATALNSALATAAINGSTVANPDQLQGIATAYLNILKQAGDSTGTHADPSIEHYAAIGTNTGLHGQTALGLLNSVVVRKSDTDLATIPQINRLIAATHAVLALAHGDTDNLPGQDQPGWSTGLKDALALLGVQNLSDTTLPAVLAAIQLSPASGQDINTLDRLQSLADKAHTAQQKINAYADGVGTPAIPTADDYRHMGVGKVNTTNVDAFNSALASQPVTSVQTATPRLVQGIVDAYQRILTAADGVVGNASVQPLAADYGKIGLPATLTATLTPNSAELGLLNNLVDAAALTKVNTVTELEKLATTATKIMAQVKGTMTDEKVSLDELRDAGITGLAPRTFAAVRAALAASEHNDNAVIGTAPGNKLKLQQLADKAQQAQELVERYADDEPGNTLPSIATYRDLGIQLSTLMSNAGPESDAAAALNSALRTPLIRKAHVNPPAALAAIATAYNTVLAAADGNAPAGDTLSAEAAQVNIAVLKSLGVDKLGEDTPPALLRNVQAALDAMPKADALDVAKLQATVNALTKISHLADGTGGNATPSDRFTNALVELQAAGVTVTDPTLASAVGTAIDAVTYASIDTPAKLQQLVDAYARILAEANEVEPADGVSFTTDDQVADSTPGIDPTATDFKAIGARIAGVTDAATNDAADSNRLSLLDSVLKHKARSQVDDVSEINAIGQAVARFIGAANQPPRALVSTENEHWLKDALALGVTGVSVAAPGDDPLDGNLQEVINTLGRKTPEQINTVKKIQALVNDINAALLIIGKYAEDGGETAPTVADYANAGIFAPNGTPLVSEGNLAFINAAIDKLELSDVDTRGKIKAVVNAYNAILAAADGEPNDPSGSALTVVQYLAIGVPLHHSAIGMVTLTVAPNGTRTASNPDAVKLGLLNSVVGSRSKADVGTPDKIAALARTVSDLIRTAKEDNADPVVNASVSLSRDSLNKLGLNITSDALQTAFLDAVKHKGNEVIAATGAPNSDAGLLATHNTEAVDSINKLVAIASSYGKLLGHVNNGTGEAPALSDYTNVGAKPPATGGTNALALLNSALHAQPEAARIDSLAKINKLAITVSKLMQLAAVPPADGYPPSHPEVNSTLSQDDLTGLGLTIANRQSLTALLNKLQSTANDGRDITSIAALQDLADEAKNAMDIIVAYAKDNTGTKPTEADFTAIGLILPKNGDSSSAYLDAINDALASISVTKEKADTPAKLQGIITAATHVVDAADGFGGNIDTKPGEEDFKALGLDAAKLNQTGNRGIVMLGEIIDGTSLAELKKGDNGNPIALPDKLADLLNAIEALMNTVAGRPAQPELTPDLLRKLAVKFGNVATDSNGIPTNWPAIRAAIAGGKADGSDVDSVSKLQAVVDKAHAAQVKIRTYANELTTPELQNTTPNVDDYNSIGLVSFPNDKNLPRTPLVTSDNLAAINAALRTPTVNESQANTPDNLRTIVKAYNAILARANGAAADTGDALTPAQFTAIGVVVSGVTSNTTQGTDVATRALLDSVIATKQRTDVDTPTKINNLGTLVNKVIAQAHLSAGDNQGDRITAADLKTLGITASQNGDLATTSNAAVEAALYRLRASRDDGSEVDSHAKLQELVSKAITAYQKIQGYAERTDVPAGFPNDSTRPTADDFKAVGLEVTGGVLADNALAVAASLLTSTSNAAQINTPVKLQTLLDNWNKLFALANGAADTPSLTDTTRPHFKTLLEKVGVSLPADQGNAALDLLHSSLDKQSGHEKFNGPAKLLALLNTAQAILTLADHPQAYAGNALPAGLTVQKLVDLGVIASGSSNGQAAALASALAMQADTSNMDSLIEIKPLAQAARTAYDKLQDYADNPSTPAPTAADYLDVGLVQSNTDRTPLVSADNLGAINTALASASVTGDKASDPALLKGIIEAYQHVIDWKLRADATAPTLDDYSKIGLDEVTAQSKTLLDSAVKTLPEATIKDAAHLLKASGIAKTLSQMADGNAPPNTADTALPDADLYAALGVDMGNSAKARDADGSGAALLGSVIDRKNWADVNSVGKLQTLTDLVNKFMDNAARPASTPPPTEADFGQLGVSISTYTNAQKGAIIAAIGTSGKDGQGIKSVAAVAERVTKAVAALAKISSYAEDATLSEPRAEDYPAMGVTGVSADNVASVNAALATSLVGRAQTGTQPEVQAIVTAYLKVLQLADGTRLSPDPVGTTDLPSKAELTSIGVQIANDINDNQLRLFTSAIDAVSRDKVATPGEIEKINASAAKIIAAAKQDAGTAAAVAAIELADLHRLGITGVADDTLEQVRQLIGDTPIEQINSSALLQDRINGLLRDIKLISDYVDNKLNMDSTMGATNVVLPPNVDNYQRAGVADVTAANLESINSAVKALSSGNQVNKSTLQAITNAYNHVLKAADGTPGNLQEALTRAELIRIGVSAEKLPDPAQAGLTAHEIAMAHAKLGLLVTALDAQPADKSTVKTISEIGKLVTLVNKVVDYAGAINNTAPIQDDLERLGVKHFLPQEGGNTPATITLVRSALHGMSDEALTKLNLSQVQTMSTAAYKLRMLTANSDVTPDEARPQPNDLDANNLPKPGAPLTLDELHALRMAVDNHPANIKLLNEALDSLNGFGRVNSIDRLNGLNLSDIVNRVMKLAKPEPGVVANPAAPAVVVTAAEWAKLGITTAGTNAVLDNTSLSAFVAALKLRQPVSMDTLAELNGIAVAARKALTKIKTYAESVTDGIVAPIGTEGLPTLADFNAIGVDQFNGATPDGANNMPAGLSATLSALATSAVTGAQATTYEQIKGIVDSYNKILGQTGGNTANAPDQNDYARIGSSQIDTNHLLKLTNSVIQAKSITAVDTPVEINALIQAAKTLLEAVNNGNATALTVEVLTTLGVTTTTLERTPDGQLINQEAILSGIVGTKRDGSQVDTLGTLREIANKADVSQKTLRLYAEANEGVVATVPVAADYRNIGLVKPADASGERAPLVSDERVAAINAALHTSEINGAKAGTPTVLTTIVNAYNAILDSADGLAGNTATALTAPQYTAIGVNINGISTGTADTNALALLNSVIDRKQTGDVDTPAKINALGEIVNNLLQQAKSGNLNTEMITLVEVQQLGIDVNAIPAANRPQAFKAALYAIAKTDDSGSDVNAVNKLQSLVVDAMKAFVKISDYAALTTAPPTFPDDANRPTVADLQALKLDIPATISTDNAIAVAASLASANVTAADVDRSAKLQGLLSSWDRLLTLANGAADTLALDATNRGQFNTDLLRVGARTAADVPTDAALDLLQSSLDRKSAGAINGPDKLSQLLSSAMALVALAGLQQAIAADTLPPHLSLDKLAALGVGVDASDSTSAAAAVLSALSIKARGDIDSVLKVSAIATAAKAAQAKIAAYAGAADQPTPDRADYLAIGLSVPANMLGALNSALASTPIDAIKAGDPAKVKAILVAYTRVIDSHTAGNPAAEKADLEAIGLTDVRFDSRALLDSAIKALTLEQVKNQAQLQSANTAVEKVATLSALNGRTGSPDLGNDDLRALGLDMTGKHGASAHLLGSVIAKLRSFDLVDTVTDLNARLTPADKVLKYAATPALAPRPAIADLQALGVTVLTTYGPEERAAILAAIGTVGSGVDDVSKVDTVAELNTLVTDAVAALAKISTYADTNSGATLGVPTVDDYRKMGVTQVSTGNLGAINAALATTNVTKEKADSTTEVQGIVDAYVKVLNAADGNTAEAQANLPTQDDLELLGVNVSQLGDANQRNLVISAIDALGNDKVNTPTKIDGINTSAAKILAAVGNATAAGRLDADDFIKVGITGLEGVDNAMLGSLRERVVSATKGAIDTTAQLQTLADGLLIDLKAIRDYATDPTNSKPEPTLHNYNNARINDVTAGNLVSINAAIRALGQDVSKVNNPTSLQKVVKAYNRVLSAADGGINTTNPALTRDDLVDIGVNSADLPALTTDRNTAAVRLLLGALEVQPADKSTVRTPALIGVLAKLAGQVADYADGIAGASASAPDTASLTMLGVKSSLSATEGLINDTIKSVKGSGEHALATLDLATLQSMAHAAYKLRVLTNTPSVFLDNTRPTDTARDGDGNPLPGAHLTSAELKLLGLDVSGASAARIKLLNDALDVQSSFNGVNTLAKLQALGLDNIAKRVMQQAESDVTAPAAPIAISWAHWATIGLDTTPPADGKVAFDEGSLASFMQVIRNQTSEQVNTVAKLQTLLNKLVTAQTKIIDYANDGLSPPTAQDYADMGVALPTGAAILGATNAALASTPVNGDKVKGLENVQNIVNSYAKLLALANGISDTIGANLPTVADYTLIGLDTVSIGKLANANHLRLLNDLVDRAANPAAVDTPAKLNALATLAGKVVAIAAQNPGDSVAAADELTPVDYNALGLNSLTDSQIAAIVSALQAKAPADVTTVANITSVADKAKAAIGVITAYARTNSDTAPSVGDYQDIGVTIPAGHLAAVNAALASTMVTDASADTPSELREIISSYGRILNLADGVANNPATPPAVIDYSKIGSTVGKAATDASYLGLLNSVIDPLASTRVDTPAEIDELAGHVNKVLDYVGVGGGGAPGKENLEALGVSGLNDDIMSAVQTRLQKASRIDVNTLPKLQALANSVLAAQAKIRDYAADSSKPAPTLADYDTIAVTLPTTPTAVATAIVGAVNQALASTPVGSAEANTPRKVQDIINSYAKLLTMANGSSDTASDNLPTVTDYTNVGLDTTLAGKLANANHLRLLNDLVDRAANPTTVATPARLNALATLAGKVVAIAAQNAGDTVASADQLAAGDYTALGLDTPTNAQSATIVRALQAKAPDNVDTLNKIIAVVDPLFLTPSVNSVTVDNIVNQAERDRTGADAIQITGTAGAESVITLSLADGSILANGITAVRPAHGGRVWNWSYTLTLADWARLETGGANNVLKNLKAVARARDVDSAATEFSFTLDTVAPVAPLVSLVKDTGRDPNDRITSNGDVKVEGIEAGTSWQWSADNGASWSTTRSDSSATISLSGDGNKLFKVRVSDRAGNVTETNAFNFTLDTVAPTYPTFFQTGTTPRNGEATYSGTGAESNASIAIKSGTLTLGTVIASNTGAWTVNVRGTLRVSGLRQVDGRESNANGVYTIVSLSEAARLGSTNTFSSDFSLTGTPVLDTNKEVYSMTKGGITWYVWAPVNGGYIISRASGGDEWYESPIATNGAETMDARNATVWTANSASAAALQTQYLLNNNGESPNSRRLTGVEMFGAFPSALHNRTTQSPVHAIQTDLAGNAAVDAGAPTSNGGDFSLTRTRPVFDLDAATARIDTTLIRQVTSDEVTSGTAFAPNADSEARSIRTANLPSTIRLQFGGSGLSLNNDKLLLDVERSLNSDFDVANTSIGGVSGLRLRYNSLTQTLEVIGNPAIRDPWLNPIVRSIRLKNTSGSPGERTMTVTAIENDVASPSATATLSVSAGGLWLDLDPDTAGTQFSSTSYIFSNIRKTAPFDDQVAAPTSSTILFVEVKLSGSGLDVVNDKLYTNFVGSNGSYELNGSFLHLHASASLPNLTAKSVTGLRYDYDAPSRTLKISKQASDSLLTGVQVKAIIESLGFVAYLGTDGERVAEFRLIQVDATDHPGPYSTARLIFDTTAPVLDLDAGTSGIQTTTTKVTSRPSLQTASGVGLFDKAIAIDPATDIRQIKLEYTGREAEKARDSLRVEGNPGFIAVNGNNNGSFTIGNTTEQFSFVVTSVAAPNPAVSRKDVVLSKTSGEAITSIEATAILDALRLRSTSTDTTDRLVNIILTDMAGHTSTPVISTVRIDTRAAPALAITGVVPGNQISYGLLTLSDNLGSDAFTRNLTKGEQVNLPLPAGLTPDSFLAALKALSSDWGGASISERGTIEDKYRSYLSFDTAPVNGGRFTVSHQSHQSVKGNQVSFNVAGSTLSLANGGGFDALNTDMYRSGGRTDDLGDGNDMGNIRLLYQTTTTNANSTPTVAVTFNRSTAAVGDVIGLYEGDKLLVSKTLVSADIAGTTATATLDLTVTDSLARGNHAIVAKYTTSAGAFSDSVPTTINIVPDMKAPVLSNLTVKASYDTDANAKALLLGGNRYTSITDPGLETGFYDKGLIFSGSVNTPGVTGTQKYLVTLNMGGKLLGFDTFDLSTTEDARTSSFTLQAAPNLLAPGLYRDLTVTVTNITENSIHNGQTSTIKDVSLGWYWAPQYMGNLTGGNGNDGMLLSPPVPTASPLVTTGAGVDTLTVGAFGRSGATDAAGNPINFSATVTDFQLGLDKVQVWKQNITADNYRSFVNSVGATTDGRSTTLVVDLDGAGAQRQTYTLTLQNLRFDAANTHTIFGV